MSTADTWRSATNNDFKTFANREKKSLRHAAVVATFLDLNKNRPGPANIAGKTKKIDMYDFPVPDCTQEQTLAHSFLLSFVNANDRLCHEQ